MLVISEVIHSGVSDSHILVGFVLVFIGGEAQHAGQRFGTPR